MIRVTALAAGLMVCAAAAAPPVTAQTGAPPDTAAPVLNERAVFADPETGPITTMRHWKIKPGTFPQFLEASQTGVWPYFEKIGARVIGMWQVTGDAEGPRGETDYDEVYLMTQYVSRAHWKATREAWRLGGNGPDFEALMDALAIRRSLTIETSVIMLEGVTGPTGPYYLPGTLAP